MIQVDCASCIDKPCCRYHGWKVFFLESERNKVAAEYGEAVAAQIDVFHKRGEPVYAVDLPCPFFDEHTGSCGIYKARPFICRVFPVEIEPITETTYVDQGVCPKSAEAQYSPVLVQIAVDQWCSEFWNGRSASEK